MQELIDFLLPTSTEAETGTATAIVGSIIAYLCGWDDALEALLVLMVLDYATGIVAAYVNPNMTLDSRKGLKGVCRKVLILAVVALAHFLANLMGQELVRLVVVFFFIGNEGLSIVENAANAGVPVPEKLKETLEQFKTEKTAKRSSEKK